MQYTLKALFCIFLRWKIIWNIYKKYLKNPLLKRNWLVKDLLSQAGKWNSITNEFYFFCIKLFILDYRCLILDITAALKVHQCFQCRSAESKGKINCKVILFSALRKDEVKVLWKSMNMFSHSVEFSFFICLFFKIWARQNISWTWKMKNVKYGGVDLKKN